MSRRYDPRRVKADRNYKVKALADLYDVLTATIGNWRKDGLAPIDGRKPYLFKGASVRAYLIQRQERSKRPCGPGQIYCAPCKQVRNPQDGIAWFQQVSATSGNLIGHCPTCARRIFRRVSMRNLAEVARNLAINFKDVTAT